MADDQAAARSVQPMIPSTGFPDAASCRVRFRRFDEAGESIAPRSLMLGVLIDHALAGSVAVEHPPSPSTASSRLFIRLNCPRMRDRAP